MENSRLQRLVDILDSQPELVFCLTVDGRITYMSERSEAFMKTNLLGDLSAEIPTHIKEILSQGTQKDSFIKIPLLIFSPPPCHPPPTKQSR